MAKKLREHFGKQFFTLHCFAHKDHLTFGNAMKKILTLKNLETLCNKLFSFYSKSHKRTASLHKFLEMEEEDIFYLTYVFDVR